MAELTDREDAFPVPAEQLFQRKIITLPRETWLVAMQFYRIGRHRGTDQLQVGSGVSPILTDITQVMWFLLFCALFNDHTSRVGG